MNIEHVNEFFKTNKTTFDDFIAAHGRDAARPRFVRNRRTGEIFAIQEDGQVSSRTKKPAVIRWSVDGKRERMPFSRVDATKDRATYEDISLEDAKSIWDAEYGIIPDERAEDGFYARGDLLEHWNDIVGSSMPQSFSVKTGKREFVGTRIPFARIPEIMRNYGKGDEVHGMIVDSVVRQILNNKQMELADGMKVKGVPRDGGRAVMISGFGDKEAAKMYALKLEMDARRENLPTPGATPDKKRVFIRADADTVRNLIERHPAKLFDEEERQIGDTSWFFDRREETSRTAIEEFDKDNPSLFGNKRLWLSPSDFKRIQSQKPSDMIGRERYGDDRDLFHGYIHHSDPDTGETKTSVYACEYQGDEMFMPYDVKVITGDAESDIMSAYESIKSSGGRSAKSVRGKGHGEINRPLPVGVFARELSGNDGNGGLDSLNGVGVGRTGNAGNVAAGGEIRNTDRSEELKHTHPSEGGNTSRFFDRREEADAGIERMRSERPYLPYKKDQETDGAFPGSGNAGSYHFDVSSVVAARKSLERLRGSVSKHPAQVNAMLDNIDHALSTFENDAPIFNGGERISAKNFVTSMQHIGFGLERVRHDCHSKLPQ